MPYQATPLSAFDLDTFLKAVDKVFKTLYDLNINRNKKSR